MYTLRAEANPILETSLVGHEHIIRILLLFPSLRREKKNAEKEGQSPWKYKRHSRRVSLATKIFEERISPRSSPVITLSQCDTYVKIDRPDSMFHSPFVIRVYIADCRPPKDHF